MAEGTVLVVYVEGTESGWEAGVWCQGLWLGPEL